MSFTTPCFHPKAFCFSTEQVSVCKQLEDKLEVPIPHDLIFLVSGKWALKARNQRDSQQLGKYLESYLRKATCSTEFLAATLHNAC